jgi:nucleoid-associated protein YgaU
MSPVRWTTTCVAMAGTGWLLAALGPDTEQVRRAVTTPQALVDTAGPDALLLVAAATAGWLCWAWGALGLLLTGLSALPGAAGRAAGLLLVVVLPAGARRAAAVAVGLSLAAAGPAAVGAACQPAVAAPALVEAGTGTDRPGPLETGRPRAHPIVQAAGAALDPATAPTGPAPPAPPDWPSSPSPGPGPTDPSAAHMVLRGDCLWDIAADRMARLRPGLPVTDADLAIEVQAWWQANEAVIGPDPDLLLPGQVLQPPR